MAYNYIERLKEICYKCLKLNYKDTADIDVRNRLEEELEYVKTDAMALSFLIVKEIIEKSEKLNYHGTLINGALAGSFIVYLLGRSGVDPLKPHYLCLSFWCEHNTEYNDEALDGYDLVYKDCPDCMEPMLSTGHDIPLESFYWLNSENNESYPIGFDITISSGIIDTIMSSVKNTFPELRIKYCPGELLVYSNDDNADSPICRIMLTESDLLRELNRSCFYFAVDGEMPYIIEEDMPIELPKTSEFYSICAISEKTAPEIFRIVDPQNFHQLWKLFSLFYCVDDWNDEVTELIKQNHELSNSPLTYDELFIELTKCGIDKIEAYRIVHHKEYKKALAILGTSANKLTTYILSNTDHLSSKAYCIQRASLVVSYKWGKSFEI